MSTRSDTRERVRCFMCGNPGGDLVLDDLDGREVIVHADTDDCPDLPDDYGVCLKCSEARPLHTLQFTTSTDGQHLIATGMRADDDEWDGEIACDAHDDPILWCRVGGCQARAKEAARYHRAAAREAARDEEQEERDPEQDRRASLRARADAVSDTRYAPIADLASLWGVSLRTARTIVSALTDAGWIESRDVPARSGGVPRKEYRRAGGVQ